MHKHENRHTQTHTVMFKHTYVGVHKYRQAYSNTLIHSKHTRFLPLVYIYYLPCPALLSCKGGFSMASLLPKTEISFCVVIGGFLRSSRNI